MNRDPSVAGLASLVQSRGRNGDSMLVHMTPDEVQGLNALALAHGGQLTINPETGLYEANFLKKLLPTIIGFALAPLTAGTSLAFLGNPLVSGALVGGIEGLRTGDLGKGLMAGLGAFGGASLGAGLTAAAGTGAGAAGAGTSTAGLTGSELAKMGADDVLTNTIYGGLPETAAAASGAGAAGAAGAAGGAGSTFGTFGKGLQALGSQAGRTAFMEAIPGGMAGIAAGGMGLANAMTPDYEQPDLTGEINDSYYQSYGYDPAQGRFLGGRFIKGYPGFPGYADGGAVMPRPNYAYPQAGITRSSYAPSLDYTRPQEVVDGYEVKLDPFTGEERFAEGGAVDQDRIPTIPESDLIMSTMPVREAPQQSLQQYYQSLLTPPQQQAYDPTFFSYMQALNNYVSSPVAPPPPPPKTGYVPPPPGTVAMQPNNIDYNAIRAALGGKFGQFGNMIDFSSLQNRGGDGSLVWDSAQGRFVNPAPVAALAPYQFNPRFDIGPVDPADFAPPTEEDIAASQKYLSMFDVSGNPPVGASQFDFAGATPNFDMSNMPINQMGDMSAYGTQFQGFQSLPTDFGSVYQAPAMKDYSGPARFAPIVEPTDFGSMGNYGLGALGTTYTAPTFQMPSFDLGSQAPAVPTTSFQAPMTTGMDSTAATAPQFGFGNSDVLYGQADFGMGGEQNIFGFAEGGAIQKAAAGKLVTGDGDGMSDDIRANINGDQEARLADGEFVIPADVVSHLGNGSTDAGADKLYTMMDRIRKARTGRIQQAPEIDAEKYFPA